MSARRIAYSYDPDVGNFHYGIKIVALNVLLYAKILFIFNIFR